MERQRLLTSDLQRNTVAIDDLDSRLTRIENRLFFGNGGVRTLPQEVDTLHQAYHDLRQRWDAMSARFWQLALGLLLAGLLAGFGLAWQVRGPGAIAPGREPQKTLQELPR
jgi:hypothetical protein